MCGKFDCPFIAFRKPMGNVPTSPPSMRMPMFVDYRAVSLTALPLGLGPPHLPYKPNDV